MSLSNTVLPWWAGVWSYLKARARQGSWLRGPAHAKAQLWDGLIVFQGAHGGQGTGQEWARAEWWEGGQRHGRVGRSSGLIFRPRTLAFSPSTPPSPGGWEAIEGWSIYLFDESPFFLRTPENILCLGPSLNITLQNMKYFPKHFILSPGPLGEISPLPPITICCLQGPI